MEFSVTDSKEGLLAYGQAYWEIIEMIKNKDELSMIRGHCLSTYDLVDKEYKRRYGI